MNINGSSLAVLCLATFVAPTFSQTPATFATKTFPAAPFNVNSYVPTSAAIDVNNDGIQDVVQLSPLSGGGTGFVLQIANGDGTFQAPTVPTTIDSAHDVSQIASGDFNNDGNADLAFAVQGTTNLVVFLGTGNGAFAGPIAIPQTLPTSGATFASHILLAADINVDGNLDLVSVADSNSGFEIDIFPGDGRGGFGAPVQAWMQSAEVAPAPQIMTGDFNGDALPDLAFTLDAGFFPGQLLVIMLGYGNFGFEQLSPFPGFSGNFPMGVGDLNHDGNTDIFGIDLANNQFDVIYGNKAGNFVINSKSPVVNAYAIGPLLAGDFNGDGIMDVVTSGNNTAANAFPNELIFFYGNSTGAYTQLNYPVPSQGIVSNAMVGEFSRDIRPSVAALTATSTGTNPSLILERNATPAGYWGDCNYPPTGAGIGVCAPQNLNGSTVQFRASANSFGPLRKIELWVDGAKLGEQYNVWENRAWFSMNAKLATGTHEGAYVRNDTDNRRQTQYFTFTVK